MFCVNAMHYFDKLELSERLYCKSYFSYILSGTFISIRLRKLGRAPKSDNNTSTIEMKEMMYENTC